MNLTESITPRSDQVNADDLITGPRTVTIVEVTETSGDQPVNVITEEFGQERPYKPNKSMRRVLAAVWGAETADYHGRKLTLFRNPKIRFGKEEVGGIQISHMSNIDEPVKIMLTQTRGRRAPFIVQPLEPPKDTSGREWLTELAQAEGDVDLISALGAAAAKAHAAEPIMQTIRVAFKDAKEKAGGQS